jgi:hypothetical protein
VTVYAGGRGGAIGGVRPHDVSLNLMCGHHYRWSPLPHVQAEEEERQAEFDRMMNPVIKVYCRHTAPSFSQPWQRERQFSSYSSGVAVAGDKGERWLLTNAHSVEYNSQARCLLCGFCVCCSIA